MSLSLASLWRRSERVFNYTWNRCIMLEWCSFKNVYFLLCLIFLHSTTCCALETLTDLLSPHWNVRGLRGCVWFAAVTWHMAGTQQFEYMNEWTDGGTVQNLFLFLTPLGFPLMEWLPLHCVQPMCYLIRKARGLEGNPVLLPVPVSPKLWEPNPLPGSFDSRASGWRREASHGWRALCHPGTSPLWLLPCGPSAPGTPLTAVHVPDWLPSQCTNSGNTRSLQSLLFLLKLVWVGFCCFKILVREEIIYIPTTLTKLFLFLHLVKSLTTCAHVAYGYKDGICYELNCVSPQKVLKSYPQVPANKTLFGIKVLIHDQVKMRSLLWALVPHDTEMPCKGAGWGQYPLRSLRIPEARREASRACTALKRNRPRQHLIWLSTPWTEIINVCCFSHPVCDTLLQSPWQINPIYIWFYFLFIFFSL